MFLALLPYGTSVCFWQSLIALGILERGVAFLGQLRLGGRRSLSLPRGLLGAARLAVSQLHVLIRTLLSFFLCRLFLPWWLALLAPVVVLLLIWLSLESCLLFGVVLRLLRRLGSLLFIVVEVDIEDVAVVGVGF